MNINKLINVFTLLIIGSVLSIGCQKMDKPALGKYPADANPPGGPLKFYAAMDGSASNFSMAIVDSIRANFGVAQGTPTITSGVSGNAYQGNLTSFATWPSANDFGTVTDFTISFWLNITVAQKDHSNADGVLALSSSKNFWSNFVVFADHESSTSDSMQLKFAFSADNTGNNTNWDFTGYSGNKRWPHMYDGNWHHVVFTYSAASKTGTLYRDGVQFDQKMNESIVFDGNASVLVLGGFQEMAGIVDTWSNNSWMSGFPGKIDQVRLYGTALSASDIQSLYNNKK